MSWFISGWVLLAACGGGDHGLKAGEESETGIAQQPGSGDWELIDAGYSHTCGLRSSGTVECWGFNGFGQADAPSGRFQSVDAGMHHSCGVTLLGTVECWGFDAFGQATAPEGSFKSVSAGGYQTCAISENDEVVCWGGSRDGEADAPAGSFVGVSAGEGHTCAVTTPGKVQCWGLDDRDQASPPQGRFDSVSSGWTHTCGVESSGALDCWGEDANGQSSPPEGSFSMVSASRLFSCGLSSDSSLSCWGWDHYGQSSPPEGEFLQVSTGGEHACGIDGNNEVQCWGNEPEDGESAFTQTGFSVEGVAWNYGKFNWAEAGKCIHVTDPSPVLVGSPPLVLASSTIAAGGAFRVNDVETVAELGLFMTVDDCDETSAALRTATGIGIDAYEELGEGEMLGERLVLVVDDETAQVFDESLRQVGYTGAALATTGAIMGFVVGPEGAYLDGATIDCGDGSAICPEVFYMDADDSDGLFGSGSTPNGVTQGAAEAVFLIPDASLANYIGVHPDYTFSRELFGHTDGMITVLTFVGR